MESIPNLREYFPGIYYSFCIMVIFYFINWNVAAETIEVGKLFKGGNYLRKYGTLIFGIQA